MHITIFGSGYVGLVTGTCLANVGNHVLCVDVDDKRIAQLQQGHIPIHEPGLETLLKNHLASGHLQFTTDMVKAVAYSEIQCIAVGTPPDEDGSADLRYVLQVADTIGKNMLGYKLIMDKSTVPVGTADKVRQTVQAALDIRGLIDDFDVVSNPEFLKEGAAIEDFMKPDRIIIGTNTDRSAEIMRDLYAPFNRNHNKLLIMDIRSAELTKYAANAMLATKISFMNEMAHIAEHVGADIEQVRLGIGSDPRIGFDFIYPGIGYGGSCFHPDELLFIECDTGVKCLSFEEVFALAEIEEDIKVLSGDMTGLHFEPLAQATVRMYEDDLIEILFTLGKKIKVTKDHPIPVFQNGQLIIKLAENLEKNNSVILPFGQFPEYDIDINLLDEIKHTTLVEHVWLNNINFVNNEFEKIKNSISLKHPQDIKRTGTVKLQDILEYQSILDTQYSNSVIFTSISQPNAIPYKFKIDEDFARFIGYYVAAGWISHKRFYLSFFTEESEYIEDAKCILRKLGIKCLERLDNNHLIFIISSELLSYLFDNILHCGVNAYQKNIPSQIFYSPSKIKFEFFKGLFRGNGTISLPNKSKTLTVEYCTVSKKLADSLSILLQSFKIVSSVRTWYQKKLTLETYLIIINGLEHTNLIGKGFGKKWLPYQAISEKQRNVRPRNYRSTDSFSMIKVKSLTKTVYRGKVYSIETGNAHLISTGGILIHNCFPKDVQALARTAQKTGIETKILDAVEEVNKKQQLVLFEKIKKHFKAHLKGCRFALWGLAFKADTDDMRSASSCKIMEALWAEGAIVQAYDPKAMLEARRLYGEHPNLVLCESAEACLQNADALIIVTEWKIFRTPDFDLIKNCLSQAVIFDGRNLYDPQKMRQQGFTYYAIGRGDSLL